MGYSGYRQKLCASGHLRSPDAYDDDSADKCSCGDKFVWHNSVDQTNDVGFPYTDFRVKNEAVYDECECCGHKEGIKEVEYHIPTEEDMAKFVIEEHQWYKEQGYTFADDHDNEDF